jgi:hypothetical protein
MTGDLETLLGERPKGMEFRVMRRSDGMWDAGFWRREDGRAVSGARRYPRSWNESDGVDRLGAEGQTRDQALANFVDLLNLLDGTAR